MNEPVSLRLRRLGIDTYQELVVYMRSDCQVCRSEGFEAHSRIELRCNGRRIIATLNVVHFYLLGKHEVGLSEAAWRALGGAEGDGVQVSHPAPLLSFSSVRAKVFGRAISNDAASAIITDVCAGRYSDIELAALVTACAGERMTIAETVALTRAMVAAGRTLTWDSEMVVDKHCVGGLPGNRTTLLVVPIVAACGLTIPKTSSRAITSPAGSADVMETLAAVSLDPQQIGRVVGQEGGCIVWGGAVSLSPADDLLLRVERPLGLDSDGMLAASIMSKKIAAGATHVVIDIPVGRTAKVRSTEAAVALAGRLQAVGKAMGVSVRVMLTDGAQPVGRGVGPALEALDVLAVLQNEAGAPEDLRQRALALAASVLEMGGKAAAGEGLALAGEVLSSGRAWAKFQAICAAQGGMRTPPGPAYTEQVVALHKGTVSAIDNRALARVAKLAGAPRAAAAGLVFDAPLGTRVEPGQPLFTVHAQSRGELAYALAYAVAQEQLVSIHPD